MLTTPKEWTSLFVEWTAATRAVQPDLPKSLGHAAAGPADIAKAEKRLKLATPLPPSFRAFLLASDGWDFGSRAVPVIRPLARLAWFKKENRQWIAAYSDPALASQLPADELYFSYSAEISSFYNPKHFPHTLQISDVGDSAVFLLNPMVVHPDGEWEAWFLANWNPGVVRHRSFAAMMHSEYRSLIGEQEARPANAPVPFADLPTVYRDSPTVTPRRVVPRKPARTISKLLAIAKDHSPRTTMNARIKAIDELASRRDQSVIPSLRALLHDPLHDVCASVMSALGTLHAVVAIPDLVSIIRNKNGSHHCAIAALGEIGTAPALDFLASVLESSSPRVLAASRALAPHRDPRGVAATTRLMLDTTNMYDGEIAGQVIAMYGPLAIDPLVAAAIHPDPIIRRRAYSGLRHLEFTHGTTPEGRRAAETLRARHNCEPDPKLAEYLEVVLSVLASGR